MTSPQEAALVASPWREFRRWAWHLIWGSALFAFPSIGLSALAHWCLRNGHDLLAYEGAAIDLAWCLAWLRWLWTARSWHSPTLRESDDQYGAWGYDNAWGGFHTCPDSVAYWTFLREFLRHPSLLWARAMRRMVRDRWRHRRCDTVDFHHYACTLDPFGKRLDDNYRWSKVWAGERRG